MSYLDHTNLRQFVSNFKNYIISRINGKAEAVHTHSASEITSGTLDTSRIPNLDASKITTGVIDIDRLPQGALERLVTVANQTARFALTSTDVQLGDTVKQTDTGMMYIVTDTANLANDNGYTEYTAGSATSVPWSGVTGKPAFANVATSGSYNDLTDKPTVPTKVSDLTNDSGYISNTDDCVHLAGAETITGDKTFTSAVVTHNITPETDNTYSLGSSSYQWASVYAQTYYYNGTAWGLDKNNEWTGSNTFSGATNCVFSLKFGSSGTYNDIRYYDNNNSNYACLRSKVNYLVLGLRYSSASNWYSGASVAISNTGVVQIKSYDGTESWTVNFAPVGVYPTSNNALELGTSSNKWKTLNGINPGALSFPANSYVAIDTTNFNKTGGLNTYTAPSDGWIGIQASSVSYNADYYVFIGRFTDGSSGNPSYWSQGQVSPLMAHFEGYIGQVFIPVIGGKLYHIRVNGDFSSGGYIRAYFYPCLGNV